MSLDCEAIQVRMARFPILLEGANVCLTPSAAITGSITWIIVAGTL